jgi:short-subunit dehydrogenase
MELVQLWFNCLLSEESKSLCLIYSLQNTTVSSVCFSLDGADKAVLPNIYYYNCDLSSPSQIRYIASGITQKVGHPTILVLNAGITRGAKSIMQTTEADLKLTFGINTFSQYHLCQAFLPHMIARNHGMVVTVASLAGYTTAPEMVMYAASKAAAISFHEGLQVSLVLVVIRTSG